MTPIPKIEKVQGYKMPNGAIEPTRDDALRHLRKDAVLELRTRSRHSHPLNNQFAKDTLADHLADFISEHGEEILHILLETKKAVD